MPTTESGQSAHTSSSHRSQNDSISTTTSSDPYPRLSTRRFRFRPFSPADIAPFTVLAGEHRIADTTIGVPHPYTAEFPLKELALNRVYALQLERHPLVARVLATVGMQQEGLVRKRVNKGGLVENVVCWAISRSDWQTRLEGQG